MSYQTGTTHYNLPQTAGTDKRDWSDTNQAFADVDAALYQATQDASGAASGVTALGTRMTTAEGNITAMSGDITTLQGTVATQGTAITGITNAIGELKDDVYDMISADSEETATATHQHLVGDLFIYNNTLYVTTVQINVGDTIVPNTNCTTTTVDTELGYLHSNFVNSTTEHAVGKDADGNTIYERTLKDTITTYTDSNNRRTFTATLASISKIYSVDGFYSYTTGGHAFKAVFGQPGISPEMGINNCAMASSTDGVWSLNFNVNVNFSITSIGYEVSIRYTK